ncbi:Dehydrogenase/reductase SDR family member 7 [Hondaea fermentalgiana]|uniref:Dehydrogenase/reductase SDR family member 7 n=1 Tax=Hondaea fermentalgiana TaxID=2315210 RepID=A0A2R5GR67_9STRA|nr:Dehydrogenase/reductase SDR family member 7 [Hondaea fermentalgiana]|eukprot:GBG33377.1 Dehydrogenase/reductase SDR family member 7 [Hondaea fermentalgiana]
MSLQTTATPGKVAVGAVAAAGLLAVGRCALALLVDADLSTWSARCRKSYFQDKVVWITGASSGIGEEIARQLDQLDVGIKLVLSSRRREPLEALAKTLTCDTAIVTCDLNDLDSLDKVAEDAIAAFGRIDFLFNNGGVSTRCFAEDTDFSVDVKVMTVDLLSYVKLTKLVLPGMIERKFGHIVNTSSLAGKLGMPLRTAYSAAKFAIIGHFDALRLEVAQHNVHVTNVCPGSVQTEVARNALTTTADKTFGAADKNIDNGMRVERCVNLFLAAVSNNIAEAWMFGSSKERLFSYLAVYMPGTFRKLTLMQAPKLMAQARKLTSEHTT